MIDPSTITTKPSVSDNPYQVWETAGRKTVMRLDPHERTAGPLPFIGFMDYGTALLTAQSQISYLANNPSSNSIPKADIAYPSPKDDSFSFGDVLDIINPLQHLPLIGTIYRSLTNDVIKPMSSIIGGTIFGGPMGAVTSTLNVVVKDRTGMDLAENALSMGGFNIAPQQDVKSEIVFDMPAMPEEATRAYTKNFAKASVQHLQWNA